MSRLISFIQFNYTILLTLSFLLSSQALADLPDFRALIKKNAPAVVNISAKETAKEVSSQQIPEHIPEQFRHFFGDQLPQQPRNHALSSGSGFIISSDGYILSNHHVVEGADEVIVRLNDRRELDAKVIGSDKQSDVALLKIEATNLPFVKLGDSTNLEVGEWVVAIGSPFGFDYSVTSGIVSALGRSLPGDNYVPFIQTDVAINPGNSGGPLFNMKGEVIGINSQIYSRTGGFMGLSFAIPMDVALDVKNQLLANGKVARGWLGVLIQEVNKDLAESFGLDKPHGALVADVLSDSPAEQAGIKTGDVITTFNGEEITFSADLPHLVGRATPNNRYRITVVRDGRPKSIFVNIGQLGEDSVVSATQAKSEKAKTGRLGIAVKDLPDEAKEQLNISKGVIVTDVLSPRAREAGLAAGDVILRFNNKIVKNVGHFSKLLDNIPSEKLVPLLVNRRGSSLYIAIKVE